MAEPQVLFKDVPGLGDLDYLFGLGDETSPMICVCLTPSVDLHYFCFCRTMNPITWGIFSVEDDAFDDLIFERCDYSDLIKQSKVRLVAHCSKQGDTYEEVDSIEALMRPLPIDYFDGLPTDFICLSDFVKECKAQEEGVEDL